MNQNRLGLKDRAWGSGVQGPSLLSCHPQEHLDISQTSGRSQGWGIPAFQSLLGWILQDMGADLGLALGP